jgi:hypothetical protein
MAGKITMKMAERYKLPFLIFTVAIAVLAPSIPITATFSLRPEFILAGILFLWLLPAERLAPLRNPVFLWMGALAVLIALSLGFNALFVGRTISLQDVFEIAKIAVYAMVFYAALCTPIKDPQHRKSIMWFQIIFLASGIVGIFQYFNLFRINSHLTPLYLKTPYATSIAGARIVGTTSNPNYFGMMMLLGACIALADFLWSRSWRHRWLSVLSLMICLVAMLLAASRTVIAIFPLASLYIVVRFFIRARKEGKDLRLVGAIAAGAVALLIVMLILLPNEWFTRMGDLLNIFEAESMLLKFKNWQEHWELYKQSPIFGLGPAKGIISLNIDNEWLLFLVRYGVAGPVLVLMMGIAMFRSTQKLVRSAQSTNARGYGFALQAFLLSSMIFMIVAAVYHHQQLMAILLLLVGLGHASEKNSEAPEHAGAVAQ